MTRRRGYFPAAVMIVGGLLLPGSGLAWAAGSGTLSGGTWHQALPAPGTASWITASLRSVSCPSPGNCAAGGTFLDRNKHLQAFVVTERAGRWGQAIEVPGTGALNAGGNAGIGSVSCPSTGNCTADGDYTDGAGGTRPFVVSEVAGRWGQAIEVPGFASASNTGGFPMIANLSCPSPGNCATGGSYHTGTGTYQAFVANQTSGTWGQPVQLAGAGLRTSYFAQVDSVSCQSPGNCTASGVHRSTDSNYRLFAATESNGRWGQAVTISLSAAINSANQGLSINTMSCASPGNCAVGGLYQYAVQDTIYWQAFVLSETGGQWGRAMDVPGLIRPRKGGNGEVDAVSCAAPGNCVAGGYESDPSGKRAFLVSETGGQWGHARSAPGLAALDVGHDADVAAVSCTAPGTCVAGGVYAGCQGRQAFVVSESGGRWDSALPVPGLAALNVGHQAAVNSISCPAAGHCTAVGTYADHAVHSRAFVASEN